MGLRKKRKNETKAQKEERCSHNRAWKAMSEYIRRRDSVNGMAKCVTCGVIYNWRELHAGHYIAEGTCSELRFDERNIHQQCATCNTYLGGNRARYTVYMIDKYGRELVDNFLAIEKQHNAMKMGLMEKIEYNNHIEKYYKDLLNQLNNNCQ